MLVDLEVSKHKDKANIYRNKRRYLNLLLQFLDKFPLFSDILFVLEIEVAVEGNGGFLVLNIPLGNTGRVYYNMGQTNQVLSTFGNCQLRIVNQTLLVGLSLSKVIERTPNFGRTDGRTHARTDRGNN